MDATAQAGSELVTVRQAWIDELLARTTARDCVGYSEGEECDRCAHCGSSRHEHTRLHPDVVTELQAGADRIMLEHPELLNCTCDTPKDYKRSLHKPYCIHRILIELSAFGLLLPRTRS